MPLSEYLLSKYRPVADTLLALHGLSVSGEVRDSLAKVICSNRELPESKPVRSGTLSARPGLRVARTHAKKLIEYTATPPSRKSSVRTRCAKLTDAIRSNDMVGFDLALAQIDVLGILADLDAQRIETKSLKLLVAHADIVLKRAAGIGRPWAPHTVIVRAGCNAWKCAGRRVGYSWDDLNETLAGSMPNFLRDLLACCAGKSGLVEPRLIRTPLRQANPRPLPKGNLLRVSDAALHRLIRAWQAWDIKHMRKN